MKFILILAFLTTATSFSAPAQSKQYVCTPCGYDCDGVVHAKAGTCSSCGMPIIERSLIRFTSITPEELCARVAANPGAILLDVRTPGEFKGANDQVASFGHFKNAININVEELESRVKELDKYKDREVLVYCSHSHRSPRASYFLSTHGFSNVTNMAGGVSTINMDGANGCLKKIYVPHPQ